MSWAAAVVPALVCAALLVGPGWLLLRLAGVRGLLALGGGPAVSVALCASAAIVLDLLGVRWGWGPLLVVLAVAAVPAWFLGRWVRREARVRDRRPAGLWAVRFELGGRRGVWVLLALVVAGVLVCAPVVAGMGAPDAVLQHWDAVFHLNGLRVVQETGNASSLGGLRPLYGDVGDRLYYPAAWHGFVALLPAGGSVTLAANVSTLVLGGLVWPLGVAALTRVLLWRWWTATPLALALLATVGTFPAVVLSTLAQWPFGTAVALVPGATALAVACRARVDRGVPATAPARLTTTLVVVGVAVAGVGLAHGSGLFSLLLLLGPYGVAALTHAAVRRWRAGQRRRVVAGAVAAGTVVVAGLVVVLTSATVQNMLQFPRATRGFYPLTALDLVRDGPLSGPVGDVVVAVALVVGVVTVLRARLGAVPWLPLGGAVRLPARERARADLQGITWLVGAWGLVVALTALAAGPPTALRVLTGFWYSQSARVAAVHAVAAVPLAALGLLVLGGLVARRWAGPGARAVVASPSRAAALGAVLALVVSLPWSLPATTQRFAEAYVPGRTLWGHMLTQDEVALLDRVADVTPPDAVVLGDPANGAALVWAVADRRTLLPQLSVSNLTADQRLLREAFADLDEREDVCEAVRRTGVTHLYLDTATAEDGAKVDAGAPGLHRAPASAEVVDSEGTATLYRLTTCTA